MFAGIEYSVWLAIFGGLVSAALGAILSHIYRDYRDRPIIDISLEALYKARSPIAIPKELYQDAKLLMDFHKWLESIVKWNVQNAFIENKFTLSQLKDIRHLAPQFIGLLTPNIADAQEIIDSLIASEQSPSPNLKRTLSRVRGSWFNSYHQDIFIAYAKDPQAVSKDLIENFRGDIEQRQIVIQIVQNLIVWLDKGLAPNANMAEKIVPAIDEPSDPKKPFIFVELLARNSGKTEILISGNALLKVKNLTINLRGIIKEVGFDIYSGKYYRVKPASIEGMTFSQDPELTNLSQLKGFDDLLKDRNHKATIEIFDYTGHKTTIKNIKFREVLSE